MEKNDLQKSMICSKKKVAIHQPHYFSWIPYWNKIACADVFIIFDTAQLPRGKSRVLRTKYLDQKGEKWLTIPFGQKAELLPIKEVKLENILWKREHIEKLKNAYRKAPYADLVIDMVAECLKPEQSCFLLDIECKILEIIAKNLDIKTKIILASDLVAYQRFTLQEYVVMLLEAVDADVYLSGKGEGSQKTIDESVFKAKAIEIEYQDYRIPPYQHLKGSEFIPTVSVLDTIFMLGHTAKNHVYQIN